MKKIINLHFLPIFCYKIASLKVPQFRPQQYLLLHLTKATNTQKQMLKHIGDKMQIHVFLNSLKIGCQTLHCLYLMYSQMNNYSMEAKFLKIIYLQPNGKIHCSLVVKKLATVMVISSNMICHLWLIGGYEFIETDMP